MNIHLFPMDNEQSGTLKRHEKMLLGYASDFCQLIEHSENARRETIKKNVYEEKLQEFARADQLDAEAIAYSRKYPKDGEAQMFADIFDNEKFTNWKGYLERYNTIFEGKPLPKPTVCCWRTL